MCRKLFFATFVLALALATGLASADNIWREAESADVIGASWQIYDDPSASAGQQIGSENDVGNDNDTAPGAEWVASYNFNAAGGDYKILFLGEEYGSDSFWVRITTATAQTLEDPDQPETGWVRFNGFNAPDGRAWDEVHSNDHDNETVIWTLDAGPQVLEIAKREDGVKLDLILVTSDLDTDQDMLPLTPAKSISIGIADDNDDAEQHLDDGRIDAGSSDLEIPYEDGGAPPTDPQTIGVRYAIDLGRSSAITSAYLEIQADKADKDGTLEPVNVVIRGELSPDAAPFEEVTNNITDRPTTAASVKWSIPPWTEVGAKFQSPDITSIIQEIIDQDGWAVGNGLVLIISDDPDNPSTGLREAEAGPGDDSAHLHLTAVIPVAVDPVPADGAAGVSAAATISTFVSGDAPKAIDDNNWETGAGKTTSTLTVDSSIAIKDLNVELDITMPGNNADLNVYIKSPDGKQVELFTDVGLGYHGFKNTILDDEASTSITRGRKPFTGIYKPEKSLSAFDGRDTAGDWQLVIIDDWQTDTGPDGAILNSWRIVVENPIVVSWTPGLADSQDVYFSSTFDDVNGIGDAGLLGNLPMDVGSVEVGDLELGTTYYWRVDEINVDGSVKNQGKVWSFSTAIGNIAVHQRVAGGNDDAEEHILNGGVMEGLGSSDLELGYEGDSDNSDNLQTIGIRWTNVGLPSGAEIIEAAVQFSADDVDNSRHEGPVNLVIQGELSPDPVGFSSTAGDITARPTTEAAVNWEVPQWMTVHEQGPDERTPDITSIVEEIIGQEGWAGGNALVLTFADDPCNPSAGTREAESQNGGGSSDGPLLHIAAITEAAGNPSPANGATEVAQDAVLGWSPGFTGISRDVYFGTASSPPKLERTTGTTYDVGKLAVSTTYYWRVDEYDADGAKHEGSVNSFTTVIGEATNPFPADHAAGVPVDAVLTWTPGGTAVSSDVYFGANGALDFVGNQAENAFDPGGLEVGASYSWRIDSVEADGTTHVGEVWTFKAPREGFGTILREVWEGIGGTSVSDLTSDPAYPASPTFSEEITSFETPTDWADNFGSRVHGWLHPVTTGDYTFWIATDDNSVLLLSADESPANAVVVSSVSAWAGARNFDDPDVSPSAPIHLEGGKAYYISGIYKEGGGGDNLAVAWQGPDSPDRMVISGYYLTPFVAYWADSPDPADGSTVEQTFAILRWSPGVTAASHDVYISDNLDDVVAGAEAAFAGNLTDTTINVGLPGLPIPDGLGGATYYWRVDAVEADPNVVYQGAIWSFTVPPVSAYDPSPADAAENVDTSVTLSWTGGLGAKLHTVYFGDDLDTVANAVGAPPLPMTTFNPGPLEAGKTYYWRVDEFNPPTNIKGDIWSFTTAP